MTETAVFGARRRMSTWTSQSFQLAARSADDVSNFELMVPVNESADATPNSVSFAAGLAPHAHRLDVIIPLAICRSRLV